MSVTIAIDTSALNKAAADYVSKLGTSAPVVVKTQGRLLLKQIITFMPPDNQAQGRKAVRRDFRKTVNALKPSDFNEPKVKNLVIHKRYDGFNAMLARTAWNKDWVAKPFTPDLHWSQLNSRGRVGGQQRKVYTLDYQSAIQEERKLLSHVGRMKSGWWPAYRELGGSLPGWITKHGGDQNGYVLNDLANKISPSVTMENHSRGVGENEIRRKINDALIIRSKAMVADVRRQLRDIAKESKLAA